MSKSSEKKHQKGMEMLNKYREQRSRNVDAMNLSRGSASPQLLGDESMESGLLLGGERDEAEGDAAAARKNLFPNTSDDDNDDNIDNQNEDYATASRKSEYKPMGAAGGAAGGGAAGANPLELLRMALSEIEAGDRGAGAGGTGRNNPVPDSVTSLLQGVEEYLQNQARAPNAGSRGQHEDEPFDNVSAVANPDDSMRQRSVLNVYMENQLDLNVSEMEYYEGVINDLTERLERMTEEKEELQEVSNSLGDRLQRANRESEECIEQLKQEFEDKKLFYLSKINDLQSALNESSEKLEKERTQVSALTNKMREKEKEYKKNLIVLQAQLDAATESGDLGDTVAQLQEKLADMEADLADSQNEMDNLSQINEDLRAKIAAAPSTGTPLPPSSSSSSPPMSTSKKRMEKELNTLRKRVQELSEDAEYKDVVIQNLEARVHNYDVSSAKKDSTIAQLHAENAANAANSPARYPPVTSAGGSGRGGGDAAGGTNSPYSSMFSGVSGTPFAGGDPDASDFDFAAAFIGAGSAPAAVAEQHASHHAIAGLGSSSADYSDMDAPELRDVATQKDQQIKAQISQLQSLQDALSEHRSASAALKEQRNSLKQLLETAKSDLSAAEQTELDLRDQVSALESDLASSLEQVQEYRNAGETMKAQIQDLETEIAYKNELAHQQSLRERAENNNSNNNISDSTPMKTRMQRTEQQLDEVSAQLRVAAKQRDDAQLELEKAQIRLESKDSQFKEAHRNEIALREELDRRLQELDTLKLSEMKHDTDVRLQQIDADSDLEQLREQVSALEADLSEAGEELRARDEELAGERKANAALRDFLGKLGEKDDTTEDLLEEFKLQREDLASQLDDALAEIRDKADKLQECEDKIDELARELEFHGEEESMRRLKFERGKSELEAELAMLREKLDIAQKDHNSHVDALKSRMDLLLVEKNDLEESLRQQRARVNTIERELHSKSSEVVKTHRSLNDVVEIISYFSGRVAKQHDSFERMLQNKCTSQQSQLAKCTKMLKMAAKHVGNAKDWGKTREAMERQLRDTKQTLKLAVERHEEDAAERAEMSERLERAELEIDRLNAELLEDREGGRGRGGLMESGAGDTQTGGPAGLITAEEYSRIVQRLDEAEERAVRMSTDGAKSFARSARNIAFLEGETARLKTLVDHLRVVNVKLTGDLKTAHMEGMRSKSLEHRLKMMVQDEVSLKDRIRSLEVAVEKKEKDLLALMQSARASEEKKSELFETEMSKLNGKLRQIQEKYNASKKENERLNEEIDQLDRKHTKNIKDLDDKVLQIQIDLSTAKEQSEAADSQVKRLCDQLDDKEDAVAQLSKKISALESELAKSKDLHAKKQRDLSRELELKQSRVKALEQEIMGLKSQLNDLEADFITKDEELANKLSLRATADDEIRRLKAALQANTTEIVNLSNSRDELQYKVQELGREVAAQASELETLKEKTVPQQTQKLKESEFALQQCSEDLTQSRAELRDCRTALSSAKDALSKLQSTHASLQEEHTTTLSNEQVLRSSNESLAEENEYLRVQVDELIEKASIQQKENASLQATVNEYTDLISDLELRIKELEGQVKSAKLKLTAYDNGEMNVTAEMRTLLEMVDAVASDAAHFTSTSAGEELGFVQDKSFSQLVVLSSASSAAEGEKRGEGGEEEEEEEDDLQDSEFESNDLLTGGDSTRAIRTKRTKSQTVLVTIREYVTELRKKSVFLRNAQKSLHTELERSRKATISAQELLEHARDEVQTLQVELETKTDRLESTEQLLDSAMSQISSLESAADLQKSLHEATAQRATALLRDLDSNLLEALAKANDSTAGIVPINADAMPDLSIAKAVVVIHQSKPSSPTHTHSTALIPTAGGGAGNVPNSTEISGNSSNIVSVLTTSISEVDRAAGYLNSVIEATIREIERQKAAVERAEAAVSGKESDWSEERSQLMETISGLEVDLTELRESIARAESDSETAHHEIDRLNHQITEIARNNSDLEAEFKSATELNGELRGALNDAETLCMELRSKIRVLQGEIEKKNEDFGALNDQLEMARQQLTESELQQEKTDSYLGRVRAEKDALDNVRRSLEMELDRCRSELNLLRERSKEIDDEKGAAFEVEKMLAALGTTLDQIQPDSTHNLPLLMPSSLNSSLMDTSNGGSGMGYFAPVAPEEGTMGGAASLHVSSTALVHEAEGKDTERDADSDTLPLSVRVDDATERLGHLRAWHRDQQRSRRVLESHVNSLSSEVAETQALLTDTEAQLKKALRDIAQTETELSEKSKDLGESQREVTRLRDELLRAKKDREMYASQFDNEKKQRLQLTDELAMRDSNIAHSALELENVSSDVGKLQEEVASLRTNLANARAEAAKRAEQLKTARVNSDRFNATIAQLEEGLTNERRDKEALEKRFQDLGTTAGSVGVLRAKTEELEKALGKAQEEIKTLSRGKVVLEEQIERASTDLESGRRKILMLENRIDSISQEKSSYADEVAETRRRIAQAKEQAEEERLQRLRAEADAQELSRRSGDQKRLAVDDFASKAEEAAWRQQQAEEEKRALKSKISELKISQEELETQRMADINDRKKLERDLKHMKDTLSKRNAELTNSAQYSLLLRTEGRNARKLVLEATTQIKELVNVVRVDAQSIGVTVPLESSKKSRSELPKSTSFDGTDEALRQLGLVEALGITELQTSLSSFREVMLWVRSVPKKRLELETMSRKLESDVEMAHQELRTSESKRSELVNSYKEEIASMQMHINELRRTDSKNPHLMHQITVLEGALKQEKERREKALQDVEMFKAQVEKLNREMVATHHSQNRGLNANAAQIEIDSLRAELEKSQNDYNDLSLELNAVNHHRAVLRDTVEQLEKQLKIKVDQLASLQPLDPFTATAPGGSVVTPGNVVVDGYGSHTGGGHHSRAHSSRGGGAHKSHQIHHQQQQYDAFEGGVGGGADEDDSLQRQVTRFKARAQAMEELSAIYRTSVLALYADGASYGAAQFGWQPQGVSQEFHSKGIHLIGVGWIERELNTVRHSYEDEIRLLDGEVAELRAKLRQANSYTLELRKRFEDNMKAIYRSSKSYSATGAGVGGDGLLQQFEHMRQSLDRANDEISALQQDLSIERAQSKQRHACIVDDLVKALQMRDAALGALKRLEKYCTDHGLDVKGLAIYETLKSELNTSKSLLYEGAPPALPTHSHTQLSFSSRAGEQQQYHSHQSHSNNNTLHMSHARTPAATAAAGATPTHYRTAAHHTTTTTTATVSSRHPSRERDRTEREVREREAKERDRAIQTLMRGLVETDHELMEAERRANRAAAAAAAAVTSSARRSTRRDRERERSRERGTPRVSDAHSHREATNHRPPPTQSTTTSVDGNNNNSRNSSRLRGEKGMNISRDFVPVPLDLGTSAVPSAVSPKNVPVHSSPHMGGSRSTTPPSTSAAVGAAGAVSESKAASPINQSTGSTGTAGGIAPSADATRPRPHSHTLLHAQQRTSVASTTTAATTATGIGGHPTPSSASGHVNVYDLPASSSAGGEGGGGGTSSASLRVSKGSRSKFGFSVDR